MTIPTLTHPIALTAASSPFAAWVQQRLVIGGYLPIGNVDGKIGDRTLKAFADFKEDAYLSDPRMIGQNSINLLATLEPKDKISEQPFAPNVKPLEKLGRTGKSATLPIVGLVYANEEILEGSFLTWGEMLRNFERMPAGSATFGSEEQIVRNIVELAKAFRTVRSKFGSPIRITSAYRPYFLQIGASRSQHRFGRGLDIAPHNGDLRSLLAILKVVDEINGIGLGQKSGFLHMDTRPSSKVVFGYG